MAKTKTPIEEKRIRTFWFSSRLTDADGKELINVATVDKALTSHVTVESYAYIIHDKDTISRYDKEVDEANHAWGNIGDPKPEHIHGVAQLRTPVALKYIAQWFGLPVSMICFQEGRGGSRDPYLDNVAYLTHEFEPPIKEKHIYDRNEVVVGGVRVDIWQEIDKVYGAKERHKQYKISAEALNDYIHEVATKGVTLREARERVGEVVYLRNEMLFKKARQNYVQNVQPMPGIRTVLYVDCVSQNKDIGKGGMGKTVCTHALAKQFAKEFGADIRKPYEELVRESYIFDMGGEGVGLQSYDGQPVFVMNEMDSYQMYKAFGRRGTKELLDNFPTRQDQNIKYGSTVVTAKYIIINGIERFDTFIKGLGGIFGEQAREDKDLTQYYRRFFAHITLVNEEYMDMFFNKGIMDDTAEYEQYYTIKGIYAPFKKMIRTYDDIAITDAEGNILQPLISKAHERENRVLTEKLTTETPEYQELMERIRENQQGLKCEEDDGFVIVGKEAPPTKSDGQMTGQVTVDDWLTAEDLADAIGEELPFKD